MGKEGRKEEKRERDRQRERVGVNQGMGNTTAMWTSFTIIALPLLSFSNLNILNHKVNKAAFIGLL